MTAKELIQSCAEFNDGAAWEEFVARFQRPISLSILRTTYQWRQFSPQISDDLIQETYLKLCANKCQLLLDFADQHPELIVGYVKTVAVNVARDYFKSFRSQKRGSGEVSQITAVAEAKSAHVAHGGQEAIEREVLIDQINQCLESCVQELDRERDCTIFWLYYQQGMSAKDIAALPMIGLSAKGVESAIFRLTRLVREQLVDFRSGANSKSVGREKGFLSAESY